MLPAHVANQRAGFSSSHLLTELAILTIYSIIHYFLPCLLDRLDQIGMATANKPSWHGCAFPFHLYSFYTTCLHTQLPEGKNTRRINIEQQACKFSNIITKLGEQKQFLALFTRYTLMEQNYHSLLRDAAILPSHKCPTSYCYLQGRIGYHNNSAPW